jgi:hypothetical protein
MKLMRREKADPAIEDPKKDNRRKREAYRAD